MTDIKIKNCMNCGHRRQGICMRTGWCWEIERMHPTRNVCDKDFSGWVPRPTLWQIIKGWFK